MPDPLPAAVETPSLKPLQTSRLQNAQAAPQSAVPWLSQASKPPGRPARGFAEPRLQQSGGNKAWQFAFLMSSQMLLLGQRFPNANVCENHGETVRRAGSDPVGLGGV